MSLEYSRAIILRCIDYHESSKIITVLTREQGKFALMARGAKKHKSPFAAVLEPGNLLDIGYVYKSSRNVQDLRSVDTVHLVDTLRTRIDAWYLLFEILDRVNLLIHEHENNEWIFQLLEQFLPWFTKQQKTYYNILPYLLIRFTQSTGIDLQEELSEETTRSFLHLPTGTLTNHELDGGRFEFNQVQTEFVRSVLHGSSKKYLDQPLSKSEYIELIQHLDSYFHYHIEGYHPHKSQTFFELI
jgi:DNA repair protein RecO (recombination protein O)